MKTLCIAFLLTIACLALESSAQASEAKAIVDMTFRDHEGATLQPLPTPLVAGQCSYTDGVSMADSGEVSYVVPVGMKRFEAMAGLIGAGKGNDKAGVVFSAAVDGKPVYNSGNIACSPWNRLSRLWIPVKQGQTLTLSAEAWGEKIGDWKAVWAEPRFIPVDAQDWKVPPPAPEGCLAPTPPMAWNSWYVYRFNVNEDKMKRAADLLVSKGFKDAGYSYCNLDDGWIKGRRGMTIDSEKFPNGLKPVGDYIHAKGLNFGLYGRWDRMIKGTDKEPVYAQLIADAGADFVKYDFVGNSPKKLTLKMLKAVRDTGRPITFLACTWGLERPWEWAPEEGVELWRSGYDIDNVWNKNTKNHIGILNTMDRNEPLAKYQRPGHWNDPDMFLVGGEVGVQELRSQFGMWCIMASPLVLGLDLGHKENEVFFPILLNREAIAVNQDKLGMQGWRVQKMDQTEVWMKPLANGDLAVAMLNRDGKPAEIKALWSHLCLDGERNVRDLWNGKELGMFNKSYSQAVPGHGVALLRMSK